MKAEHADLDAYFRAANYLTVGQIYLQDNPLLREPLRPEHVKPRLLGHWGTSPGLSLLWAHLNRFITRDDLSGLGMPGDVAVYVPFSYTWDGCLLIVARERVTALEMDSASVMALVVSGGVSRV